jgi:hypothetical protein
MITLFRDLKQTDSPYYLPVEKVLDRIKNGNSRELCEKIRMYEGADNKSKRNELKKLLPAICFSGKFINRSKQGIVEHSGLICIDFDGFLDEWSMLDYKAFLINDEYSYAVFVSPSGDGLKVLVKIPPSIDNHVNFFLSLKRYYNVPEFDTTTKDISRVCFESWDPDLYINENSTLWEDLTEEEHLVYDTKTSRSTIRLTNHEEIVRRLLVWWERDFGMVHGQKNNNLFILAAALNDFGVSESDARQVLLSYDEGGKEREILNILRSAYKNVSAHGTKFYEDNSRTDSIRTMAKQGVPLGEIMSRNASISQDVIKSITQDANDNDVTIFWSKNTRGNVVHINHLYKEYLEYMGYGKYYVENGNTFVFVQVGNNIISDAYDTTIKDAVLNDYLYKLEDKSIYNYFADKKGLFKEDHLSFLNTIKPNIMVDNAHTAYLYYRNCMVKVTANDVEIMDYSDIDGYIWEKQIINRDFVKADYENAVYKKFIANIGGKDDIRIRSIESTAGYLMHSYKPPSYAPAVIINDEVISDNPEGGTGKGIFVNSLGHMKRCVTIDGKSFTFNKSFPYQTVSADTQLLVFDDVSRYFDFEKLFSIITEGITLEKKNKDAIKIPFEKSPKIIITTNYAIKGAGNSFERRKWELEFAQHYHKGFTPEHEFGHQLFTEWDKDEWARFDNYMIANLQLYLRNGLQESQFKNLRERKFIAETSMDFYEWCKDRFNVMTKNGSETLGIDLHRSFVLQNPDYSERGKYCIPLARFYRWVDLWGEFQFNQRPVTFRSSNGKMIRFEMKPDEQGELNF